MAIKTTDTTNGARGFAPCTPEASKGQKGKPRHLYVLELEGGFYYVGSTAKPDKRFRQHQDGKAAAWTRLHRPVQMIECRPAGTDSQRECEKLETLLAMEMMDRYGAKKVRGGIFYSLDDCETEKRLMNAKRGRLFKRSGGMMTKQTTTTCHGCIHLTEQQDNVGWCTFHWQYRSINLERVCEGAQFFDEEA